MSRTNRNTSIDVDENGKLIARVELRSKLWENHVKELFGTVKNPREKMRSDTEYKMWTRNYRIGNKISSIAFKILNMESIRALQTLYNKIYDTGENPADWP